MHHLLDILASGVHDAKNQLFSAESQIATIEAREGLDLSEIRYAIEAAAKRLSDTLASYHLLRKGATLAVTPTVVADLFEEVVLEQSKHLSRQHLELEAECSVREVWPLDRDLITDILNNAIQNAARFARGQVRLRIFSDPEGIVFRVEDDGPGYASLDPGTLAPHGSGLLLAERLAALYERRDKHGELHLSNGGDLGGAIFELRLP